MRLIDAVAQIIGLGRCIQKEFIGIQVSLINLDHGLHFFQRIGYILRIASPLDKCAVLFGQLIFDQCSMLTHGKRDPGAYITALGKKVLYAFGLDRVLRMFQCLVRLFHLLLGQGMHDALCLRVGLFPIGADKVGRRRVSDTSFVFSS